MKKKHSSYLTWGCAEDLADRLQKTLYCGSKDGCYDTSSTVALTDMAVSMYLAVASSSRRCLTPRYASSITRQLQLSPCSIILGILYAERLNKTNPEYLVHVSSSDLFVVSLLVSSKFLTDEGEDEELFNDEWAEAAGLAVTTMNRLEREFLDAIDWNVYVEPGEFLKFCSQIETRIAFKHGMQRGWFSYTDLSQFLSSHEYQLAMNAILESSVKVISGCALVYGFSLSLLASLVIYSSNTSRSASDLYTGNNTRSQQDGCSNSSPFDSFSDRDMTRPRVKSQTDEEEDIVVKSRWNEIDPALNNNLNIGLYARSNTTKGCINGLNCMKSIPSSKQRSGKKQVPGKCDCSLFQTKPSFEMPLGGWSTRSTHENLGRVPQFTRSMQAEKGKEEQRCVDNCFAEDRFGGQHLNFGGSSVEGIFRSFSNYKYGGRIKGVSAPTTRFLGMTVL